MGDVPSFRAFRGMVAQSGSRKEVDLTDAERLRWCQPRLSLGHHELRGAGDEVLGTLGFQAKSAVTWGFTDRRRALAEAGPAQWQFSIERKGVVGALGLGATVHVTGTDSGEVAARAFFITGILQLTNGRRFRWRGGMTENGPSAFLANSGELLVRFEMGSIFDRVNTYVEVQPEAAAVPERQLLIALGLYLRLAMGKESR